VTSGLRVLLAGATGTIGRATAQALLADGHEVVCILRHGAATEGLPAAAELRVSDITDPRALATSGIRGERFDAVVSCLASRSGVAEDAWAVDYRANLTLLDAALEAGASRFVLLSAICVQKPRLAFQEAKLAFEAALAQSDLDWVIVRPTAFFKSLSGQVARVMAGKPYLVFGDGRATACKPISDRDLARFLSGCVTDPAAPGTIRPIGGPGPAITPMDQAEHLFALLDRPARIRHLPLRMMDAIVGALSLASKPLPALAAKAELARIGRYYATESMLLFDPVTGTYDAEATPSFGSDTLFDHYARLVRGETVSERGTHSVFSEA